MSDCPSAPKADALPGCATPRTAEALRFPADLAQAESDVRGNVRRNEAGTYSESPEKSRNHTFAGKTGDRVMAKRKASFEERLMQAGAEILGPTNPYEVMRFRTSYGVGVVYRGRRGETWNTEAAKARDHILNGVKGSLAPIAVKGRRTDKGTVSALLIRDGDDCFFCGKKLDGDITVEHLVAVAHGGPNHISNLFLAHAGCNQKAGHFAAPHKVKLAIKARTPTQETQP